MIGIFEVIVLTTATAAVVTAYKILGYLIERAELLTYIGCVLAFEEDNLRISYHDSKHVSGVDTVVQYKSQGDFLYTFVFEENLSVRVMVSDVKSQCMRNTIRIPKEHGLYSKLCETRQKLINEDK